MTWGIVVGIITLVGFIVSIGKIVSNNTKAMTEVRCSVDELNRVLSEQKDKIHTLDDRVDEHEGRIIVLETKTK